jgi:signal transduction histidine kinase
MKRKEILILALTDIVIAVVCFMVGISHAEARLAKRYARFENGIWVHFAQDGDSSLKIESVENHTKIPVSFDSKMAKQPN